MNLTPDPHQFPTMLRKLADDLESLAYVQLADTTLHMSLQVNNGSHTTTDEDTRRRTTADLAGVLGNHVQTYDTATGHHHGTPHNATRHGARITVFTALDDTSSR